MWKCMAIWWARYNCKFIKKSVSKNTTNSKNHMEDMEVVRYKKRQRLDMQIVHNHKYYYMVDLNIELPQFDII